jgi:hypothetical protein
MAGAFPTFAGVQPTPVREGPLYTVKTDTGPSGLQVSTVMGESYGRRYRYAMEVILQAALGEVATFDAFVVTQLGSGDSFTITDPIDGTANVPVRFEGVPALTQHQSISGWWKASFSLVSVIS